MDTRTIGVISPGDMGHVVGGVLGGQGHRVLTVLTGRSELTRERAGRSNMEDAGDLGSLVQEASMVLSIMPPENALGFAADAAAAMSATGAQPLFVDCNAVSPATTLAIAEAVGAAGADFVKVGIIGPPPGRGPVTRFYAGGASVSEIAFMDGEAVSVIDMGPEITRAAAIKMCYAGMTKGKMTLHTAVLLAAELLGVGEELQAEISTSQKADWEMMNARVPFYACDAGRWSGEMDQISETFGAAGLTPNLHKGAAEVFRLLDSSPLGAETRETLDKSRTLQQTLDIYAETVTGRKAAE